VLPIHGSISALAIDFDGVLVDSQPMHMFAWRQVLGEYGINDNISSKSIIGQSVNQFVQSLRVPKKMAIEIARAKQDRVVELSKHKPPPLYDTVLDTLREFSALYRLALVSSAEPLLVKVTLEHYCIKELFTVLVLGTDASPPKPSPKPYLTCLERLKLSKSSVVAIEDSCQGVDSAIEAGIRVIAITNTTERHLLQKADAVVDKFCEVKQVLATWANQ